MGIPSERTQWLARNVFPHEPSIRQWLKRRSALGLDVDDVIHDMYAKLITLPTVSQIENPKSYAFRIAYSIVVDHVRRTKVVPMIGLTFENQATIASDEVNIEDRLAHRGTLQDVTGVLDQLPPLCRQAFLLRRVDGLSQRETAQKLGLSEKTIEKYMTRSVRLIMDVFGRGGKPSTKPSQKDGSEQQDEGKKRVRD
jgi:RNA polymerase sigma-70 factor (ECF subfamily)